MVPEGVEAVVPYRGPVQDIVHQLIGGLRSGLSYGGAKNIAELQQNAEFMQITSAGWAESKPHDAEVTT
jgi:IMP dehydrogenase